MQYARHSQTTDSKRDMNALQFLHHVQYDIKTSDQQIAACDALQANKDPLPQDFQLIAAAMLLKSVYPFITEQVGSPEQHRYQVISDAQASGVWSKYLQTIASFAPFPDECKSLWNALNVQSLPLSIQVAQQLPTMENAPFWGATTSILNSNGSWNDIMQQGIKGAAAGSAFSIAMQAGTKLLEYKGKNTIKAEQGRSWDSAAMKANEIIQRYPDIQANIIGKISIQRPKLHQMNASNDVLHAWIMAKMSKEKRDFLGYSSDDASFTIQKMKKRDNTWYLLPNGMLQGAPLSMNLGEEEASAANHLLNENLKKVPSNWKDLTFVVSITQTRGSLTSRSR